MRISFTQPAVWPTLRPDRFAATITHDDAKSCAVALLGLPDDTGVRLNGGRPGAAQGPTAFRAALARFGTTWDGVAQNPLALRVFDAGNVEPAQGHDAAALYETHRRVEAAVRELHELGLCVVCVGGGHDLSLPAIRALAKHLGTRGGGINLDAHLDVREKVGSGMPFRQLIEGGHLDARRFAEVGVGRFANDRADVEWLSARGATLVYAQSILDASLPTQRLLDVAFGGGGSGFVSIDLDGLDQTSAPGVSAPNPLGLGVRHAALLAEAAGHAPGVLHFDLMELSPPHDESERTARVAALLFLTFLAGLNQR